MVGVRNDPRGSDAWRRICCDPDLRERFAAGEQCIEGAVGDGDHDGLRLAVGAYRAVIDAAMKGE